LLSLFKSQFGKEISSLTKQENEKFIKNIYKPLNTLLPKRKYIENLQKHLNEIDTYHIKENLYNLDFRIHQTLYKALNKDKVLLKKIYDEQAIMGILAKARETLL
jgi:hypothetical protein